jgi:hypothetical protein
MSRDIAAVPEVPTMTEEHRASIDLARDNTHYRHDERVLGEIAELVRSLSSGRGVYVPREEIDALLEDALSYHTNTTRSWRTSCINRIAKTLTRWLSGSPTPPPAEDRT